MQLFLGCVPSAEGQSRHRSHLAAGWTCWAPPPCTAAPGSADYAQGCSWRGTSSSGTSSGPAWFHSDIHTRSTEHWGFFNSTSGWFKLCFFCIVTSCLCRFRLGFHLVDFKGHLFGLCVIKAVLPVSLEVDGIDESQPCHRADRSWLQKIFNLIWKETKTDDDLSQNKFWVVVMMVFFKVNQTLTFCLLLHPAVDLRSARLWSPNEINSPQVCLVVLLCGVEELLRKPVKILSTLSNQCKLMHNNK